MALINDQAVSIKEIVGDVKYLDPFAPMTVWPPKYPDGSTPYGNPLVHLFFTDKKDVAWWWRCTPSTGKWTRVQSFGKQEGISVYRGIVTMWNADRIRSYNFFGGSELVFPDGQGGPTSSGADPAGNNLMTNQPFHDGGEQFWSAIDAPGTSQYDGKPVRLYKAFATYLFTYFEIGSYTGDRRYLFTPAGKLSYANPTGAASGLPILAFLGPQTLSNGYPGIAAISNEGYENSSYFGAQPTLLGAPEIHQDPPSVSAEGLIGAAPPPRLVIPYQNMKPMHQLDGAAPAVGTPVNTPGFTSEQLGNAGTIIQVAASMGLGEAGAVIGVAVALQESSLRNLTGGDRDSAGLFQQRPSQGWGTLSQITDPVYAATAFFNALIKVPNWQSLPLSVAAQRVQRSAFPDAYARWETSARQIYAANPAAGAPLGSESMFTIQYGPATNFRSFQAFKDFAGSSGGSSTRVYYSGKFSPGVRGSFHPGYLPQGSYAISYGPAEVWDRGLLPPEKAVTASIYDGTPFIWGIDVKGVIGSNFRGSTLSGGAEMQNDGNLSRWGRCRLLGTLPNHNWVGGFAPPVMPLSGTTASVALWTQEAGGVYKIYWLTDGDPKNRSIAGENVPLADAPEDPPLNVTYRDAALAPSDTPTGSGVGIAALPHIDIDLLIQACGNPNLLPNPNHSHGCSPILRALLEMSGIPFSVNREVFDDKGPHKAGNAIDVGGPSSLLTGDNEAVSELADTQMVEIGAFLKSVPELFDNAVHLNIENDSESVYIKDGKIVPASAFDEDLRNDSRRAIHIASSASRLAAAFANEEVRGALGVGPATARLIDGKIVIRQAFNIGQFGNRYVYVSPDQLEDAGVTIKGLNVGNQATKTINFW